MNRTAAEWLALPEAEWPVALAEVLTPGPWEHRPMKDSGICKRCGARPVIWCEGKPFYDNDSCEPPHPIVIDWNTAMEWARKCDKDKWEVAMEHLYYAAPEDIDSHPYRWYVTEAQPYHYLVAAAMAQDK